MESELDPVQAVFNNLCTALSVCATVLIETIMQYNIISTAVMMMYLG